MNPMAPIQPLRPPFGDFLWKQQVQGDFQQGGKALFDPEVIKKLAETQKTLGDCMNKAATEFAKDIDRISKTLMDASDMSDFLVPDRDKGEMKVEMLKSRDPNGVGDKKFIMQKGVKESKSTIGKSIDLIFIEDRIGDVSSGYKPIFGEQIVRDMLMDPRVEFSTDLGDLLEGAEAAEADPKDVADAILMSGYFSPEFIEKYPRGIPPGKLIDLCGHAATKKLDGPVDTLEVRKDDSGQLKTHQTTAKPIETIDNKPVVDPADPFTWPDIGPRAEDYLTTKPEFVGTVPQREDAPAKVKDVTFEGFSKDGVESIFHTAEQFAQKAFGKVDPIKDVPSENSDVRDIVWERIKDVDENSFSGCWKIKDWSSREAYKNRKAFDIINNQCEMFPETLPKVLEYFQDIAFSHVENYPEKWKFPPGSYDFTKEQFLALHTLPCWRNTIHYSVRVDGKPLNVFVGHGTESACIVREGEAYLVVDSKVESMKGSVVFSVDSPVVLKSPSVIRDFLGSVPEVHAWTPAYASTLKWFENRVNDVSRGFPDEDTMVFTRKIGSYYTKSSPVLPDEAKGTHDSIVKLDGFREWLFDKKPCWAKAHIQALNIQEFNAILDSFFNELVGVDAKIPPRVRGDGTYKSFLQTLKAMFPLGLDWQSHESMCEHLGWEFAKDYLEVFGSLPDKVLSGKNFMDISSVGEGHELAGVVPNSVLTMPTSDAPPTILPADTVLEGNNNIVSVLGGCRLKVLGENNIIIQYPGSEVRADNTNRVLNDRTTLYTAQRLSPKAQHIFKEMLKSTIFEFVDGRWRRKRADDPDSLLQVLGEPFEVDTAHGGVFDIYTKSDVLVRPGAKLLMGSGSEGSTVHLQEGAECILRARGMNPKVTSDSPRPKVMFTPSGSGGDYVTTRIVEHYGDTTKVVEARKGEYVIARGNVFVIAYKGATVDLHEGSTAVDVVPGSGSILQDLGTSVYEPNQEIKEVYIGPSRGAPHIEGTLHVVTEGVATFGGGNAVLLNNATASKGPDRFPDGFCADFTTDSLFKNFGGIVSKAHAPTVESTESNPTMSTSTPSDRVVITASKLRFRQYLLEHRTPLSRRLRALSDEIAESLSSCIGDSDPENFLTVLKSEGWLGLSGPELTEITLLTPELDWLRAYDKVFKSEPLPATMVDDEWESNSVVGVFLRNHFKIHPMANLNEDNEDIKDTDDEAWANLQLQEVARDLLGAWIRDYGEGSPDTPWWFQWVLANHREIFEATTDPQNYHAEILNLLEKSGFSYPHKVYLLSLLSFMDELTDEIFMDLFFEGLEEELELQGVPLPYSATSVLSEASVHPVTGAVTFDAANVATALREEFADYRSSGENLLKALVPDSSAEVHALFDAWVDAGIMSSAQGRFLSRSVSDALFPKPEPVSEVSRSGVKKTMDPVLELKSERKEKNMATVPMASSGIPSLRNMGESMSRVLKEASKDPANTSKLGNVPVQQDDFLQKLRETISRDPLFREGWGETYAVQPDANGGLKLTKLDSFSGPMSSGKSEFSTSSGPMVGFDIKSIDSTFANFLDAAIDLDRKRADVNQKKMESDKADLVYRHRIQLLDRISGLRSDNVTSTSDRKILHRMQTNLLMDMYGDALGPDARKDIDELVASEEMTVADTQDSSTEDRKTSKREDTKKMSMSDRLQNTLKEDAKQIALRTGVKKTRALLTETVSSYIAKRSIPRNEGESDGDYDVRLKSESTGIVKFLSSPEGQGLMAFLVGMAWPLMEDQFDDENVLEYGGIIAQEIRVQGGSDVLEGLVDEVVGPLMIMLKHEAGNLMNLAKPMGKKIAHGLNGSKDRIHYDQVSPELEASQERATALEAELETLRAQLASRG